MKRVLIASAISLFSIGGAQVSTSQAQTAEPGAQMIDCLAELPTPRKGYWSYRLIDGRKCWYEGKPGLAKSSLRWSDQPAADAADRSATGAVNQPATDAKASPLAMGSEAPLPVEVEAFIDPEDGSCCWPPRKDDTSFEDRWRAFGLQPETK